MTHRKYSADLPLVSIITIVYNGEEYIAECIDSIRRQKYPNIEYIVIDGKSTDRTLDILDQYTDRVDILVSEKDRGISDAFNKGITHANGEIIGILNSDDLYADNCISEVVDFYIANHKAKGIYFGDILYFDEESSHERISDIKSIWKYTSIYHPSVFVSKEVYMEIGSFSEEFKYTMDAEFLHRALFRNIPFYHINKCLSSFRTTGTSDINYKNTYKEFFRSVEMYKGRSIKSKFWHAFLLFKKDASKTRLGQFFYKRKHLIAPILSGKIKKK